jgi:uncharacterized membrane protein
MLSIITRILALVAVVSLISAFVPDSFTGQIDGALTHFIGYIYSLNTFVNASTIITCLGIIVNYLVGVLMFVGVIWFLRFTGGTK